MSVIKTIEIMSESGKSWEDATQSAISKASKTIKNIRSAWVKDQSVIVKKDEITSYRVNLKISFELD